MTTGLTVRWVVASALALAVAAATGCSGEQAEPPATPHVSATPLSATPVPPPPTVAPRELTLRLQPPTPAQPAAGQTFTIAVRVEGAANLGAYQLSPTYDTALLELVSMQDSGFLASTGRVPVCSTEGATGGQATLFCVTIGEQPPGPFGDGALAILEFRALLAGTTEVTVERASATMPDATDLPVRVEPVTVTVAP
jgi:hypothetical protein